MSLPVSLLVITRNEEKHIGDCIRSAEWCSDKFVVDSGSTDATVRLAEEAGARVAEHPFETHAKQRNWALEHLEHDWVLCLDADERATPGMAEEVRAILAQTAVDTPTAYRMPRKNWLLGDFIRHGSWSRDRVVRFFNRTNSRFQERRIHESVQTAGTMGEIRSEILHYTVEDLREYMTRADGYARLGAADEAERGRRAGFGKLLLRPLSRFLRSYILLWGFLDGRRGLLQASLSAYGAWMKYLYLYEHELVEKKQ